MDPRPAPFALEAKSPMIELTAEEAVRIAGGFETTTIEESSAVKMGYYDPVSGERLEMEQIDYDTQVDVVC